MIADPVELETQRALTAAFIAADPETITLTPRLSVRTTGGGRVWQEQAPRTPQDFKVVQRVSGAATDTRVPGGEQREEEFMLVGHWDAVIEPEDVFDYRGGSWQVLEIEWDNGYEKRAQVRRYGR